MAVKIDFKTSNAAFEDDPYEAVRIIREVADKINNGATSGTIQDINGNTVGKFKAS